MPLCFSTVIWFCDKLFYFLCQIPSTPFCCYSLAVIDFWRYCIFSTCIVKFYRTTKSSSCCKLSDIQNVYIFLYSTVKVCSVSIFALDSKIYIVLFYSNLRSWLSQCLLCFADFCFSSRSYKRDVLVNSTVSGLFTIKSRKGKFKITMFKIKRKTHIRKA